MGGSVAFVGIAMVNVSVDVVVGFDVALAGEHDPPVAPGVITIAGLVLAVVVVIVVLNSPVELVVSRSLFKSAFYYIVKYISVLYRNLRSSRRNACSHECKIRQRRQQPKPKES